MIYGGGTKLLIAQCVGSAIVCTATFVSAMVMFKILNAMSLLRVSKQGEMLGLDIDQHGISAYPEYVVVPSASPSGPARG
jgi:Amt family ammonium transporter